MAENEPSIEELERMMSEMTQPGWTPPEEAEPAADTPTEPELIQETPAVEAEAEPETLIAEPEPEQGEDLARLALEAQLEELRARQRAADEKFGRLGGELDYWRRKASERPVRQAEPDEPSYVEEAVEPPVADAPPRRDPTTAWVLNKAAEEGITQFAAQNPDTEALVPEMKAYLEANGYGEGRIFQRTQDPTEVHREAFRAMSEAYWHVKAGKAEEARVAVETRRAEQFSRQKEAKARASVSGSGGTPPTRQRPVSNNEAPLEDLEAQLNRARPQDFSR